MDTLLRGLERIGHNNIVLVQGKGVKASSRSGEHACVKWEASKVEVGSRTYNRLTHHGTAVVKVHNQNTIFSV